MYDANSVSPSACVSGSIDDPMDHPLARMHRWVMNKYTQKKPKKKKTTRKLVLEVFFNFSLPEETTVTLT